VILAMRRRINLGLFLLGSPAAMHCASDVNNGEA
jgi:hypothetical protein